MIRALIPHLVCCTVLLYFFSPPLRIASADLPPFIPNSVNLGVIGSLIFQESSPNLEGQMLGVFANIFGIPYGPQRNHAPREGSPDLELGVRGSGGTSTSPNP